MLRQFRVMKRKKIANKKNGGESACILEKKGCVRGM